MKNFLFIACIHYLFLWHKTSGDTFSGFLNNKEQNVQLKKLSQSEKLAEIIGLKDPSLVEEFDPNWRDREMINGQDGVKRSVVYTNIDHYNRIPFYSVLPLSYSGVYHPISTLVGYVPLNYHSQVPSWDNHNSPLPDDSPENSGEQKHIQPDASVENPQEQIPIFPESSSKPQSGSSDGEIPNTNFNGPNQDGSYDFKYDLNDQSRSEKSDSEGNVEGEYSYTQPDGRNVKVTYKAGPKIGYVPSGPGIQTPDVNIGKSNRDDEGNQYPVSQDDDDDVQQKIHPSPKDWEDDQQKKQKPSNKGDDDRWSSYPLGKGIPKKPDNKRPDIDRKEPQDESSKGGGYMPYSYSYNTDNSQKTETADAEGNVQGSYSYIDGAGVNRTVTYTANKDGFVAQGDLHPDAGDASINGGGPGIQGKGTRPEVQTPNRKGAQPRKGIKG